MVVVYEVDRDPDPIRKLLIWSAISLFLLLITFVLIYAIFESIVNKEPLGVVMLIPVLGSYLIVYMFVVMIRPVKLDLHNTFMEIEYDRGFNKRMISRIYYKRIKGYYVYNNYYHFFTKDRREYMFGFSPYISDQYKKRRELKRELTDLEITLLTHSDFIKNLRWVRNQKRSLKEIFKNIKKNRN